MYFVKVLILDIAYGFIDTLEFQSELEEERTIIEVLKGHPLMNLILDISVITFAVIGLFSSALLVIGLKKDIRSYLVPWLCVFLLCTIVDFTYAVYLVILSIIAIMSAFSVVLFLGELGLIILNLYCIACVTTQYQEYKAGRGGYEKKCTIQTSCEKGNNLYVNNPIQKSPPIGVNGKIAGEPPSSVEARPHSQPPELRPNFSLNPTTSTSELDNQLSESTSMEVIRGSIEAYGAQMDSSGVLTKDGFVVTILIDKLEDSTFSETDSHAK